MFKTKVRSIERPRPGITTLDGQIVEELDNGQIRTTSYGTLLFGQKFKKKIGFNNIEDKEPFIDVRIKPRTKDHPSDDFKLVINYQVSLSKEQQNILSKLIPSSPMLDTKHNNPNYNFMPHD